MRIWFFQYWFVLLLILNIFFDIEIIFCFLSLLFFHFLNGLVNILMDYIHHLEVKLFSFLLIRLINLFLFNFLLELLF